MTISSPAFRGIYKVTMPDIKTAKDEKEKAAYTEAAINTVVMGANAVTAPPRTDGKGSVYFKIDDKNDKKFEQGFANILAECNKTFNVDMAKKAYMQKVSEEEFKNAKEA